MGLYNEDDLDRITSAKSKRPLKKGPDYKSAVGSIIQTFSMSKRKKGSSQVLSAQCKQCSGSKRESQNPAAGQDSSPVVLLP